MKKIGLLFLFFTWLHVGVTQSVGDPELQLVNQVYAITNATVIQKPGTVLQGATILIRDGLIESVGSNIKMPFDAQEVKGDSLFVYAGFIDGLSKVGVKKTKSADNNAQGQRGQRPSPPSGLPTNKMSGVTPEVSVLDQLDPKSSTISGMRKMGFGAVHSVPNGNMIPGTGSLLLLAGKTIEEMRLVENVSMFSQFSGTSNRVFPSTTIGVISKFKDVYNNALLAKSHIDNYKINAVGLKRPAHDEAIGHMIPVVSKSMPVFFHAESVLDAHRVMALQKELGFNLVLSNLRQGWPIANTIKQGNIPVLLSLEMPKESSEDPKKEKTEEESDSTKSKKKEEVDPERKALKERKMKSIQQYESQAAEFEKANVKFGFSSYSAKSGDIKKNLQRMIKAGLTEDGALAALTTNPANMFGISKSLGTIEPGKIANMVISTGPYFEEKSQVKYVFVDGEKFEYELKKKKAKKVKTEGEETAVVNINGDWTYTIDVPQQKAEGTITFTNEEGDISGKITNEQMGDEPQDLNEFDHDGNDLSFSMNFEMGGQSMVINYEISFDGDSFSGSASVGSFGTFDIEGERVPKN